MKTYPAPGPAIHGPPCINQGCVQHRVHARRCVIGCTMALNPNSRRRHMVHLQLIHISLSAASLTCLPMHLEQTQLFLLLYRQCRASEAQDASRAQGAELGAGRAWVRPTPAVQLCNVR